MPRVSSHFSIQDPRLGSLLFFTLVPTSIAADANQTLTTAQVLGGLIIRPSLTTARTDTLPSAAALAEAIQGVFPNLAFKFNVSATGGTLTVAPGTGGTLALAGSNTIATTTTKEFVIMFTNTTIGAEAYTVYSYGTSTA